MNMHFLLFFISMAITGAVSEMVEVKRGETFRLNLSTPLENIKKLTVMKDGTDVFRHCSSEEKRGGCKDVNVTRFSLESGEIDVSLTCPDADRSDEGAYEVEVIDQNNTPRSRMFNITIIERLASNFHPTPPFIHSSPSPDLRKFETTIAVTIGVPVGTVVLILVSSFFIYKRCKKDEGNHNNHQAENEDCELGIPLRSDTNAAPETPAISIKMVDDNNRSERDLNHGA
ncbi:uncharacterized protein LOC130217457 [Danio aesculapii]|uniref:uncharacterized protein LOC130217457 n=1 Tax=Danio aesculapii TaxID=1142201 RepID=UPI0024BF645A|nr:uncharacterized protein LOC130217457 [Danio aesculapii]